MPTPASITEVRKFAAKAVELRDYCLSPEGQRQAALLGRDPTTRALRMPTEAEVMQIAAALDAGALINPRLWNETFAVSTEAMKAAA